MSQLRSKQLLYPLSGSFTGSLSGTASWANNAITASYLTGYVSPFPFTGSATISGSLTVNGPITATTLIVQTITSSQSWITGSTIFGSSLNNTHQFTGSLLATGSNHTIYGNVGIRITGSSAYGLDVSGSARVQGIITGSVNNGSLTLGAASANTVAISLSGVFTGNGAIEVSNSNPRGFINRINAQGEGGYFIQSNSANFQSFTHQINFFRAGNALNITNPVVGSEVNGFYFNPTISGQGVATIYAFRGSLASSTDRWNLYMDGTAQNYLAGNLLLGTTSDIGGRLQVSGSITAASAIARGVNFANTLVAAANNDVLVGLDINPTFTNGAFTGVTNYAIRTQGNSISLFNGGISSGQGFVNTTTGLATLAGVGNALIRINANSTSNASRIEYQQASTTRWFGGINTNSDFSISTDGGMSNGLGIFSSSRNVVIGTATDAGFRLDVNGTARVQGNTTISGSLNISDSVNITNNLTLTGSLNIESASFDYQQNLSVATGSFQTIASVATGSYRCAFFDYVTFSGSIVRAGTVVTTWSGSATEFYENYTADLGGSTAAVTLQTAISGSNIQLQAGISGSAWSVRSLVRLL